MSDETVPVDKEALAEFVIFNAFESDAIEVYVPGGVESGEVYDGVNASNVDSISACDREVEVHGSFTTREHVQTIPASGGGKLEPPTNPPEAVFKEREMLFSIHYYLEDFGHAEGRVDVA